MKLRRKTKFGWQRGGKPTKNGLKKARKRERSILGRGVSKNAEKGDNVDCKA